MTTLRSVRHSYTAISHLPTTKAPCLNPHILMLALELGIWTHIPRFMLWPLKLAIWIYSVPMWLTTWLTAIMISRVCEGMIAYHVLSFVVLWNGDREFRSVVTYRSA